MSLASLALGFLVLLQTEATRPPPSLLPPPARPPSSDCRLIDPKGDETVRVHVNRGGTVGTRFSVDGGKTLARAVAVGADDTGPRVTLILIAPVDTIWDFRGFPGKRLSRVIVLGAREQGVANLPRDVPVRFETPLVGRRECRNTGVLYQADQQSLGRALSALTGIAPTALIDDSDPAAINIDGGRPPRPSPDLLKADDIRGSGEVTRDAITPGIAGMIELLGSGAIRYGTQADADAWMAVRAREKRPKRGGLSYANLYVVTRTTELPRGLNSPFNPNFLIPSGVPRPSLAYRYYMMDGGRAMMGDQCDNGC